jgi:hypothetical protein
MSVLVLNVLNLSPKGGSIGIFLMKMPSFVRRLRNFLKYVRRSRNPIQTTSLEY